MTYKTGLCSFLVMPSRIEHCIGFSSHRACRCSGIKKERRERSRVVFLGLISFSQSAWEYFIAELRGAQYRDHGLFRKDI
jgi:hypothetical protein